METRGRVEFNGQVTLLHTVRSMKGGGQEGKEWEEEEEKDALGMLRCIQPLWEDNQRN